MRIGGLKKPIMRGYAIGVSCHWQDQFLNQWKEQNMIIGSQSREGVMKTRRHSNNKGLRQCRKGKTYFQVKRMARKLGLSDRPKESDAFTHCLIQPGTTRTLGASPP